MEPREGEEVREAMEGALGDGGSEYDGWVPLFNSSAWNDDGVGVLSLSSWLRMRVKPATVGCLSFRGGFLFEMSKVVLGRMLER